MINIVYRLKSPKFFEEAIDEVELDGVIVRPTYLSICQASGRSLRKKIADGIDS